MMQRRMCEEADLDWVLLCQSKLTDVFNLIRCLERQAQGLCAESAVG